MKYVLYAIARAGSLEGEGPALGLDDAPLEAVALGNLEAIVSPLSDERAARAGVEDALMFARVVEQLHRRFPVLPMRYGGFVYHRAHAAEFLSRFAHAFDDALEQVAGREEMGVRILIERRERDAGAADGHAQAARGSTSQREGRAYLASRAAYYAQKDRSEESARRLTEQAKAAFAGLFTHCSSEHLVRPEGEMLSLAFLVDRKRIEAFRRAFRRFEDEGQLRATCSGPWPPYAFAAEVARPSVAGLAELAHLS